MAAVREALREGPAVAGPLAGLTVLVLEDDAMQATDQARRLAAAGAKVVGPFGDAALAVAYVDQHKPDCAVIDVNLGSGPNFAPARALLARGVKLVFVSGYEPAAAPDDLMETAWVQKPADGGELIAGILRVTAAPPRKPKRKTDRRPG